MKNNGGNMNKLIDMVVETAKKNYKKDKRLSNMAFLKNKDNIFVIPLMFRNNEEKQQTFQALQQYCADLFVEEAMLILNATQWQRNKKGEQEGICFLYENRTKTITMWADTKMQTGNWTTTQAQHNLITKNIQGYI